MFERFTERARQVIVLAQDEARQMRHFQVGTEHLLLGLLCEERGVAARSLDELGITIGDVRQQVLERTLRGDEPLSGQIPFTDGAKQVFALALRQALVLGHNYISTEHLLLGLAVQKEGTAAKSILAGYGADSEKVRHGVLKLLKGHADEVTVQAPPSVQKLNYREMSASDLKWLIVNATTELARRVNLSS